MRTATIPGLAPETPLRLPEFTETTLSNGLKVILARRIGIPLVELRMTMPPDHVEPPVARLAADSLFSGTADETLIQLARRLQGTGGSIRADAGRDGMTIAGNGLAAQLSVLLRIIRDVLIGAEFPQAHFESQRARTANRLSVAERSPDFQAARALEARLWSGHPYGCGEPTAVETAAVERNDVAEFHRSRLRPAGAHLVVVGDIDLDHAIATVEQVLGSWRGGVVQRPLPPLPQAHSGPVILVDRPGSVQSSIRTACPAVDRSHPDHAAQHLADLVYGGCSVSRLVMNLRESKGFGYSMGSRVDHMRAGSVQVTSVDVATESTAPALAEIIGELRGMAELPPSSEELDVARGYALGGIKLCLTTQAGIAEAISWLAASGLSLTWMTELFERVRLVTTEDVWKAGVERMNPESSVTVVLADGDKVAESLAAGGHTLSSA